MDQGSQLGSLPLGEKYELQRNEFPFLNCFLNHHTFDPSSDVKVELMCSVDNIVQTLLENGPQNYQVHKTRINIPFCFMVRNNLVTWSPVRT